MRHIVAEESEWILAEWKGMLAYCPNWENDNRRRIGHMAVKRNRDLPFVFPIFGMVSTELLGRRHRATLKLSDNGFRVGRAAKMYGIFEGVDLTDRALYFSSFNGGSRGISISHGHTTAQIVMAHCLRYDDGSRPRSRCDVIAMMDLGQQLAVVNHDNGEIFIRQWDGEEIDGGLGVTASMYSEELTQVATTAHLVKYI